MIEIPGKRKNSTIYVHNDYSYNADTRCTNRFRCSMRRTNACRGVLTAVKKRGTTEYVLDVEHDHEPNPEMMKIHTLKNEMLELCSDSSATPRAIYETVCRRYDNIPNTLTLLSVRSILDREIKKHRQDVPATIMALDGFLRHYGPLQEMYKGSIITVEGSSSLLFSTTALLEALETASQIFVRCQNWVLATDPPMSHMMSVHIEDQFTGIAATFILCETLSEATYHAVWNKILQLAPGMRNNLETVICDYEKAAVVVISELFPTAKVYGNWSSYKQALWKEWSSLELSTAPRDLLAMALSMPLAPSEYFEESLKIMQVRADAMARDESTVLQFMAYMRTVWLPISRKLSVYGCTARFSNTLDSFQRTIVTKITANNNLRDFFGQWKKLINDQDVAVGRLRVNGRVSNGHTRKNREQIEKISRLQQDLVENRLSIKEFLNAFNLLYVGHEQNRISASQAVKSSDLDFCAHLLAESASTDCGNDTNVQRRNDIQRPERHSDQVTERPSTSADNNRTRSLSISSADVDGSDSETGNDHGESEADFELPRVSSRVSSARNCSSSFANSEVQFDESEEEVYQPPADDYGYHLLGSPESDDNVPFKKVELACVEKSRRKSGTCCICIDNAADKLFQPCNHLCCCADCASILEAPIVCPLCKGHVLSCITVIRA